MNKVNRVTVGELIDELQKVDRESIVKMWFPISNFEGIGPMYLLEAGKIYADSDRVVIESIPQKIQHINLLPLY